MAFLDKDGLRRFWEIILSKFVAKEEGKGLSSNDFTDEEKEKLAGIEVGGSPAIIDVVELPETDIREDVFYRLLTGAAYDGSAQLNSWKVYVVDVLPDTGEMAWDGTTGIVYYQLSNKEAYGYVNTIMSSMLGVPVGWYPGSVLVPATGYTYGGIVYEITNDMRTGTIYLYVSGLLYHYNNAWDSIDPIGFRGTGAGAEVHNNLTNIASGHYSHAEGFGTTASGYASHAEGHNTTAEGYASHAEGTAATASGGCSHAEGGYTTAEGYASHAEGHNTTAIGLYSHAEGYNTTASGKNQHVEGEYNIADSVSDSIFRGKYIHIAGNGTSINNRSNAYTLDWSGNGWFAGGIKVGGTGQDDEAAVSVLLSNDMTEITNAQIDEICGATIVSGSEVNL